MLNDLWCETRAQVDGLVEKRTREKKRRPIRNKWRRSLLYTYPQNDEVCAVLNGRPVLLLPQDRREKSWSGNKLFNVQRERHLSLSDGVTADAYTHTHTFAQNLPF